MSKPAVKFTTVSGSSADPQSNRWSNTFNFFHPTHVNILSRRVLLAPRNQVNNLWKERSWQKLSSVTPEFEGTIAVQGYIIHLYADKPLEVMQAGIAASGLVANVPSPTDLLPQYTSTESVYQYQFPVGVEQKSNLGFVKTLIGGLLGKKPVLSDLYLHADESVDHFLKEHHFLIPILNEGAEHICRIFGQRKAILRVVAEPDFPESEELIAAIEFDPSKSSEAYAFLEQFDTEWWLEASKRTDNYLNFTIEYI